MYITISSQYLSLCGAMEHNSTLLRLKQEAKWARPQLTSPKMDCGVA